MSQSTEKYSGDEVTGIEWPESISTPVVATLVAVSKPKSLRELVARWILIEGQELWDKYSYLYLPVGGERTPQDLAIREGYQYVGKEIIDMCKLVADGEGEVRRQIRTVERGSAQYGAGISEDLKTHLVKGTQNSVHQAEVSFKIDPSGLDLLEITQKRKEVVYGKNDPAIYGFVKGRKRYEKMYHEAVARGATPDQGVNFLTRAVLRTNRVIQKIRI